MEITTHCGISLITCDALRVLVLFVQFKKRENHLWRSLTFRKVAGSAKSNIPALVFHIFKIVLNRAKRLHILTGLRLIMFSM